MTREVVAAAAARGLAACVRRARDVTDEEWEYELEVWVAARTAARQDACRPWSEVLRRRAHAERRVREMVSMQRTQQFDRTRGAVQAFGMLLLAAAVAVLVWSVWQ